jgi:hypothetical protein
LGNDVEDSVKEVRFMGSADSTHPPVALVSEAGRGVGATGVTPKMGVVVTVPDRRQLDLPPRSLVLEVA